MSDAFGSIILDCDFCENAEHFKDKAEAIDQEWNWMETGYKDGTELITTACPDCDPDKVHELDEKKREALTYSENSEKASKNTDPAQGSLVTTIGSEKE